MSDAVLIATMGTEHGDPAAALPLRHGTVLGRLLDQLASLGVQRAWVLTRAEWVASCEKAVAYQAVGDQAVAATVVAARDGVDLVDTLADILAGGPDGLVLCAAEVATHREALAGLLADPRIRSGALTTDHAATAGHALRVLSQRGRLVSAESAFHSVRRHNGWFLGVLKVDASDRQTLVGAVGRLTQLPALRRAAAEDLPSLLLVALIRSSVHVAGAPLGRLSWARPLSAPDAAAAEAALDEVDEDRVLLDSAVKADDGFFATFCINPYSRHIARWTARRGWTPNQVTLLSAAVGLMSAGAFAAGHRAGLVAGAVLLQLSLITDCVDGQLARYTRTFSKLGAWLDFVFDRVKEQAVFAGLAIGAARTTGDAVWTLAGAAVVMQTVRHMIDFSYAASQHADIDAVRQPPLEQSEDTPRVKAVTQQAGQQALARAGRSAVGVSLLLERRRWTHWVRKVVGFPIGERWALISVTAAIWSPRVTFVSLLACGAVATAYKVTGRVLRSLAA